MASYVRLVGRLVHNLVARVGEDLADCAVFCRRGLVYKLRSFRLRYDDVGPSGVQEFYLLPEQLALLVESVQNKPWFCELDRKAAQDLVHSGGPGCFVVRPSASTRSLTLTIWFHHRAYNILIRQREDGLLALGSKKDQEMTFRSVEEMVRHYEIEPLILYSGGELTGRTRLRAPPPGLVGGRASASGSSDGLRRSSNGSEQSRRSSSACLRTTGNCDVPFSSTTVKRDLPIAGVDIAKPIQRHCSLRKCSSAGKEIVEGDITPEVSTRMKDKCVDSTFSTSNAHQRTKRSSVPGRAVPSLSLPLTNDPNFDSTCL
ncbi:uncharacterized protein LOC129001747 [Macrosteles quadrilineatus]|uniref:uncharacterized protein LOC129001747 n=1 Tax=Macrosteles quadrilineatus TaxID=74068 RepID=UPI0023E128DA|nr:uncharacterized protein LOC129001747 [Macrosteles quadrilineatus]